MPPNPGCVNLAAMSTPAFIEPNPEVIDRIFDFARRGHVEAITMYLEDGFDPNAVNPRGDSLLIIAAYHQFPEVSALLLRTPGIAVDYQNSMGFTALTAAAFKGDAVILRQLFAAGANVNHRNLSGQTALMFAALTGRLEAVKLLLEHGADASFADASGKTAAILAAEQGAEEVEALLRT